MTPLEGRHEVARRPASAAASSPAAPPRSSSSSELGNPMAVRLISSSPLAHPDARHALLEVGNDAHHSPLAS